MEQSVPIHFPHWHRRAYAILGLLIALGGVAAFATTFGSVQIPFLTICRVLFSQLPLVDIAPTWLSPTETIILEIRLPRVTLAGLVGAALAIAGVALGALFLGSIVSYLIITSGEKVHGIIFWLMGSFALSQWSEVRVVLPYVVVGVAIILLYARPLNIMHLDEEQAQQLGINVERLKLILLVAATLITAAAVCFAGTIGFVGIIIPHAVRLVWGPDYRFLLPLSVLSGAIFLILADLIARTALAPTEVPIGVITAICGAPFFLYLLRRRKRAVFF